MRKALLWVVAVVMVLVVGGSALAAIPESGGVIQGCYLTSGNPNVRGALRVIDTEAGEVCGSGETAISWNQTGPAGPQGSTGGLAATTWPTVVGTAPAASPPASSISGFVARCDEGQLVLGGGFTLDEGAHGGLQAIASEPRFDIGREGWVARVENYDPTARTVTVYAICTASP